jgi:hypothetical protein
MPEYRWECMQDVNGDVDVLPLGEEHERGAECVCKPTVEIVGARLVIVHNAFDHREIVEQAMAILNGEEDA